VAKRRQDPPYKSMDPNALEHVALRFRLLGDPLRLRLLGCLAQGERSVSELVAATAATQANVSKHLAALLQAGILARRKEGLRVFYSISDPSVFELCDIVCGSLRDRLTHDLAALPRRRGSAS
jgi:DNA-binding transcriptional ArsR family regulator